MAHHATTTEGSGAPSANALQHVAHHGGTSAPDVLDQRDLRIWNLVVTR